MGWQFLSFEERPLVMNVGVMLISSSEERFTLWKELLIEKHVLAVQNACLPQVVDF